MQEPGVFGITDIEGIDNSSLNYFLNWLKISNKALINSCLLTINSLTKPNTNSSDNLFNINLITNPYNNYQSITLITNSKNNLFDITLINNISITNLRDNAGFSEMFVNDVLNISNVSNLVSIDNNLIITVGNTITIIVSNINNNSPLSNVFISSDADSPCKDELNYGGCGALVARKPVALQKRVRFPPTAFKSSYQQPQGGKQT